MRQSADQTSSMSALVDAALIAEGAETDRPPLSQLLEALAKQYQATGCVLWESENHGEGVEPTHVYVLASWFEGDRPYSLYHVPIQTSFSGGAILNRETAPYGRCNDLLTNPAYDPPLLYRSLNITRGLAVPVMLSEGCHGTVSIYRREEGADFSDEECERFLADATRIPKLFQAMRDQQALRLLERVNQVLSEGDFKADQRFSGDKLLPPEATHGLLDAIEQAFGAIEVTLYVADYSPTASSDSYWLEGTTWKWEPAPKVVVSARSDRESVTGWVLAHRKPVHIFDLQEFCQHAEDYRRRYPGLTWRDSLNVTENLRCQMSSGELAQEGGAVGIPIGFAGVPIVAGERCLGMLRCTTVGGVGRQNARNYFTRRDIRLLEMVAARLSSSLLMALRRRQLDVPMERKMRAAFVDLSHQLKTPLNQLIQRIDLLARSREQLRGEDGERFVHAMRGLGRRAWRVASNIRIFKNLDERKKIELTREPLTRKRVESLLVEMAEDHRALLADDMIRFSVDRPSLVVFSQYQVKADFGLFEQAVSNLYDNAGKYGYPDTTVHISAGVTSKAGYVFIAVSNEGLPLKPHETRYIGTRGWRSDLALATMGGEGSGIGLWFVDRVMKAHGGRLEVQPTGPSDDRTVFRLLFPID